jgi:copper homeostasis protein
MPLEICVENIDSVINAISGGADRLELCSGLIDGGITPSDGFINYALNLVSKSQSNIKLCVLIRPRSGDFAYNRHEKEIMLQDIQRILKDCQVGIVCGALLENGEIDREFTSRMIDLCKRAQSTFTFHRAIDMTREQDVFANILVLEELGADYLLSSGLSPSAVSEKGTNMLLRMNQFIRDRNLKIKLIGAGGITSENVQKLKFETELSEFHASARSLVRGKMEFIKDGIFMGGEKTNYSSIDVEYSTKMTLSETVEKIMDKLKNKGQEI